MLPVEAVRQQERKQDLVTVEKRIPVFDLFHCREKTVENVTPLAALSAAGFSDLVFNIVSNSPIGPGAHQIPEQSNDGTVQDLVSNT